MFGLSVILLRKSPTVTTIATILVSFFVQMFLIGKYLDNSIVNTYASTAQDAADYAKRAQDWKTSGFDTAFGDAYRMPGYPLVILTMHFFFPSAPYLGVRLLQITALAFSAGIIKVVLEKYVSLRFALFASIFYTLLPLWHFSPILIAESLSSVILVGIIYTLSNVKKSGRTWHQMIKLSFLLAVATYLKPNNLMLLIVVFGFLVFTLKTRILRNFLCLFLSLVAFLAPWILFANHAQPGFFGLTTNSGANLYVGTGMVLNYDNSQLAKSAIKWKVDPRNNTSDLFTIQSSESPASKNSQLTRESIQIWKERPFRQFGYGIDKALIAFGIKSNSVSGYVIGFFNVLSICSGILLLRMKAFRPWGFAILTTILLLAFQATIFQADRRFVAPLLLPLGCVCMSILLGNFHLLKSLKLFKFVRSARC